MLCLLKLYNEAKMVFDVFSIDAEVNVLHPIFCPTISNIQVKDASR